MLSRRDLWKTESKLDAQARHASEQLKQAESSIAKTMDRVCFPFSSVPSLHYLTLFPPSASQDTSTGLRAARWIAEELGIEGYYGPLYELFEVEERYKTAVEVTAGTSCVSLFSADRLEQN